MREAIKAIPITEVFDLLGVRYKAKKALCPIHNDRTPSMSYDVRRNMWYCFVCGFGGDSIRLVERVKGLSFKDALLWLNDALGLGLSQNQDYKPKVNEYLKVLNDSYDELKGALDLEFERLVAKYRKVQSKKFKTCYDYNFEFIYHDLCDQIDDKLRELENARSKFRTNPSVSD